MNTEEDFESEGLPLDLSAIATAIRTLAQKKASDTQALLKLLRMLESLHREIRDGLFQDSLPENRQELYALLRDIEGEGGWPYIYRGSLRSLLVNFSSHLVDNLSDQPAISPSPSRNESTTDS